MPSSSAESLVPVRAAPRSLSAIWADLVAAEWLRFPMLVGAVHLLIVQVVASLAYRYGTPTQDSAPWDPWMPPQLHGLAATLVEPLRLWDGLWYKLIAEQGYDGAPGFTAGPTAYPAFWPLFPWLMRLGHDLTGVAVETAGWGIANLSFFGALILLYRLVELDFDAAVARRTVLALAFFPTALFFSAVYTESLFLLLAVAALYAARRRNWLVAGVAGLLAALTRSQGIFLLLPFAVLLYQQYRPSLMVPKRWLPAAMLAALPVFGPIIFGLHLDSLHIDRLNHRSEEKVAFKAGNPVPWALDRLGLHDPAFVYVQFQWARFKTDPLTTLRCGTVGCTLDVDLNGRILKDHTIRGADWGWIDDLREDPSWSTLTSEPFRARFANSDTVELVCTILFFALAILGLTQLPLYYSAYIWPPLIVPLFAPSIVHPLFSMPRFGLVLFPLFVVLAMTFRERRMAIPALEISALLLVIFTAQFAQWYWVS